MRVEIALILMNAYFYNRITWKDMVTYRLLMWK